MCGNIVKLSPEIDHLVQLTRGPNSLASLQTEACHIATHAGARWQQLHYQLQQLQHSRSLGVVQKLQLASCERHFLAFYTGYSNHESMFRTALTLVSLDHLDASLNLISSSAKCCASAGDFEQALQILAWAFNWAKEEAHKDVFWPIFNATVFVCNRMGRHHEALYYAKHCSRLAAERNVEAEIQSTRFTLRNATRLAKGSLENLSYEDDLKLLSQGKLKYDSLNQFILPVDAALAYLDQSQPDCRSARACLAQAEERIVDANDYAISQFLLAQARLHLAFGQRNAARDAIMEASQLMPEADWSLAQRVNQVMTHLDLAFAHCEQKRHAVTAKTWKDFRQSSSVAVEFALTESPEAC